MVRPRPTPPVAGTLWLPVCWKVVEDLFLPFRLDADAGIGDGKSQYQHTVFIIAGMGNPYGHAPLLREFDGVTDKSGQDLHQAGRVGVDIQRHISSDFAYQG